MEAGKLSFIGHLDELRMRLIKSAVCILACATVVYSYSNMILAVLAKPVGSLVFLDPTEAFATYIKVSFWGGLLLSSPFLIYQAWKFAGAALTFSERRHIGLLVPVSFVLFMAGAGFGFAVVIRYGLRFLLSFGSEFMKPMISLSNYVSFIGAISLAFGLVFQLPIVLVFLASLGIVTPQGLARKRKYAAVLIFIASGILTPGPDIFSQCAMAFPLLVLYEISIFFARIVYRRRTREKGTR